MRPTLRGWDYLFQQVGFPDTGTYDIEIEITDYVSGALFFPISVATVNEPGGASGNGIHKRTVTVTAGTGGRFHLQGGFTGNVQYCRIYKQ